MYRGADPYTEISSVTPRLGYRESLKRHRKELVSTMQEGHDAIIPLKQIYKDHLRLIESYTTLSQGGGMINTDFFGEDNDAFHELQKALAQKLTRQDFATAVAATGQNISMPAIDFKTKAVRRAA